MEIYSDPETGVVEAVNCPEERPELTRLALDFMGDHLAAVRREEGLAGFGCPVLFLRSPLDRLEGGPEQVTKNLAAPVCVDVPGRRAGL
ncbi:MAG: hypothetical protein AAGJ81_10580 [Verrucomicrobiota bacterium]